MALVRIFKDFWTGVFIASFFLLSGHWAKNNCNEVNKKHTQSNTAQKNEIFHEGFLQPMWPNPQETVDLVTYTGKPLMDNLNFWAVEVDDQTRQTCRFCDVKLVVQIYL